MASANNWYKASLRELLFVLVEQFRFDELAGKAPFEQWGTQEAKAVLEETYRFGKEVLGPLNASGDREGCRLESGGVVTPRGFVEAWKRLYEAGFKTLSVKPQHGGQGAPRMLHVLVEELLSGSNSAFNMYPGLAHGAAELVAACGTPEQVRIYAEKMFNGQWGGTMCLTEPHAGTDVGAAKTSARRNPDGTYRIRGTKIFISGGDHDLAENIIHLALARVEDAPPGTKGLSLFIVPKKRVQANGSLDGPNDVQVASIEHKMGINASATCVLNFGDNGECIGELLGSAENLGMSQMFLMMNGARIAVGLQGLALASTAYLNAVEYARERKQGSNFRYWKDPTKPRVPIIDHPDVRRMLLDMKSHVEGIRALVMKLAWHLDKAEQLAGSDDEKTAYHRGQVELLTPLVKSYASDEAYRLCAQAMQVYGGAGYLKDHPIEQYCRDSKIFSIYEGTNHIQAMDLVGRKMGQAGGMHFQHCMADITAFIEANRRSPIYGREVELLAGAQESTIRVVMSLLQWSQESEKLSLVPLNANGFLAMLSQLVIGWLLLDAAVIADQAKAKLPETHPDHAFYEGKKASALWYARNILPEVERRAKTASLEDRSPMDLIDEGFGSV